MRTPPVPTHRCRRCGHAITHYQDEWRHATGGNYRTPTCRMKPDPVAVQVPYAQFPRWSITPQSQGYVIRQDRQERATVADVKEACARLLELAELRLGPRA